MSDIFRVSPATFYGATSALPGRAGLVPVPPAGSDTQFLQGDGTWGTGLPLDVKLSVRATTTANITLSGAQTIDGVAVVAGNRVLVKDQTLGANNGIYVAAAGAWARSADANTSGGVTTGMFTFVSEGTVGAGNGYVLTTPDPIVLGTTVLTFTQFSGAGEIVAGNNITKTGNTIATTTALTLINSVTSTAASSLVLATGSFGAALTLDSSTAKATFAGLLLAPNGTAAAPSYSFTADATKGFYSNAANQIAASFGGSLGLIFGSQIIYGPNTNPFLLLANAGAIGLSAAGTNQSITLTPSGTGDVVATLDASGGAENGLSLNKAAAGAIHIAVNRTAGTNTAWSNYFPAGSTQQRWYSGGDRMVLTAGGNLLLGGLTTDGTGVLQFPAGAGDATSGITLASGGINLFASSSTILRAKSTGSDSFNLILGGTSGDALILSYSGAVASISNDRAASSLALKTSGGTTALTLDSSQNATFAGAIIGAVQALSGAGAVNVTQLHTDFTSTGGAQALTLANGTAGQIKTICHVTDGGSGVLTPTSKTGYTTITFTNAGDSVTLRYSATGGWYIVGIFGAVAA